MIFPGSVASLKGWIISFLGLGATSCAGAILPLDNFTLKSWSTEDGLPQMTVRAMTQTRDGYLWVGTLGGVAHFDGVRFQTHRAANTPELYSDTINVLYEDRHGNLWIGTEDGGIARYHQGQFTLFSNADGLRSITINAIAEDGDGVLWVGTAGGLHRLVSSGRFERVPRTLVPVEVITGLRASREGGIWVITLEAARLLRHGQLVAHAVQSPKVIRCFELDRADDLWLGFKDGTLGRVQSRTMTLTNEELPADALCLRRDRNGDLWLGTSTGELWRRDSQDRWTEMAHPSDSRILTLHDDSQNNLWLGIEGVGLCRLREKLLTILTPTPVALGTHLTSLVEDHHGRIWAGSMGDGLLAWQENQFVRVPVASTAMNVTSLLCDRDGNLICGTLNVHHGQLYRRATDGEFVVEPRFGSQCRTLFEDRDGGLWVGKWRGGAEHYRDGRVTRYAQTNGLSNDRIYSITQDQRGDIWIGTLKGLNRLAHGRVTCFYREDGLGGNDVRTLFVDRQGTLWAGSSGGGLTRYQNGRFATITTREGLISDWVEQIVEDDAGNLWLGSSAGIMRASLAKLNDCASGNVDYVLCSAFRREEGLPLPSSGTSFQPSCLKTRSGHLWFATEAGVVVIDPKQIKSNPRPPAVYIEELSIDGETQPVHPAAPAETTIPPGKNRLEFRYTGLDLSAPASVRFKYRLENYDRDWVNAGTRRHAVYTRVPPGQYRFRVTAANNDGVWSEAGAALRVSVVPPWWQTGWFRSLAIAAMSGLIFGAYELRVHQYKKARAMQESFSRQLIESQEQERKRVAGELHDSLGQSLQIIKGRAQLGLNRTDDPAESAKQLQEISMAASQAIHEVRTISHALRPMELDQLGLTKAIESLAEKAGATSESKFACELDDLDGICPPEMEISLYRIAQEGINNVLKHAGASEVIVELKRTDGAIRFSVFDNGRGFVRSRRTGPSQPRFGHGLAGIEERVKLMGGEFDLQSAPGKGTRLTVECAAPPKRV